MPYVVQPTTLQGMFQTLDARILKLEMATRFTMPVLSADPTVPRQGDLWMIGSAVRYLDSSGNVLTLGTTGGVNPIGPAGGGLSGTYPNPTVAVVDGGSA